MQIEQTSKRYIVTPENDTDKAILRFLFTHYERPSEYYVPSQDQDCATNGKGLLTEKQLEEHRQWEQHMRSTSSRQKDSTVH